YVWVAGESTLATSVRRYLVNERSIAKDRIYFCGYWRSDRPGRGPPDPPCTTLSTPADLHSVPNQYHRRRSMDPTLADVEAARERIRRYVRHTPIEYSPELSRTVGADVFIGVSAPNLFGAEQVKTMAKDPVVFALANPDPEIDPLEAQQYAAVVATGRSDYPNQINNVLAFPGVFRGLLDAHAHTITDEMLLAAADAISDVADGDRINASFIVPSVFDAAVAPA
ncbi:malic enzyme-like NAD(P)-binding protein, partial [Kibdelosporangium lantanae]